MIVVVDYGVNNLKSVVRALTAGGHVATLSSDPAAVRSADRLVIPGVGNFGEGSRSLERSGLGEAIRHVASSGKPLLGICLGLQLLFSSSEEADGASGLGLLKGNVVRIRTTLPVPHVGWASVGLTDAGAAHPVLAPLFTNGEQFFYHVHSYHPADLADGTALGTADYGGAFATIVGKDNILGAQFHPEKSQQAGIAFLSGFANWRP